MSLNVAYIIAYSDLEVLDVLQISSYSIEYDIDFDGKTTVEVPRVFEYSDGDFIMLKNESGAFYQGLIESVDNESGSSLHTINCIEIEQMFNTNILLENEEYIRNGTATYEFQNGKWGTVYQKGIEGFIAAAIKSNFTANPNRDNDTLSSLDYISVTQSTATSISASVETEDGDIYNLMNYISTAREKYGIFLDFTFTTDDNGGAQLSIDINKRTQNTLNIDATLSDVKNYDETYTVDVLSKLTCVWKIPDTEETDDDNNTIVEVGETQIKYLYLLNDRTTTTDVTDENRAKGKSDTIYVEADWADTDNEDTDDMPDEVRQTMLDQFTSNSYEHSVTADIRRNSLLFDESELYVGHSCNIKTVSHGIKSTIISNVSYENDDKYVSVKFGDLPITLIEKLKKERK